ncbi:MAG: lysophospholipid acyltransferase family protein [Myxococcota bacterium]
MGIQLLRRRVSRLRRAAAFLAGEFLPPDSLARAPSARRLQWLAENLCAIHGIDVQVTGIRPAGPAVLVANHISYLDPVAILQDMPCAAIAKREVAGWPVIGSVLDTMPVLFVQRSCGYSGARVLRSARRMLASGVSVLTFPEGTTTTGSDVLPFKRGVFGLAAHANVPVVPISVRYESTRFAWVGDDPFVPHYLRSVGEPVIRIHLHYHGAIRRRDGAAKVAEMARRAIRADLRYVPSVPPPASFPASPFPAALQPIA